MAIEQIEPAEAGAVGLARYDDLKLLDSADAFRDNHSHNVSVMALAFIRELSDRLRKHLPPAE